MRRLALLACLAALAACPPAAAHGGGGAASGFTSTVTAVQPPLVGIVVQVLDGDDRLRLTNGSGKVLIVQGYDGEPYLRFSQDGIYRNTNSPATYLNEDRYAQVGLPSFASAEAPPDWRKVASGRTWEWHDHRIHWMSTTLPPAVRAEPDREHLVFDWQVPLAGDRKPLAIAGRLDYAPPSRNSFLPLLLGVLAVAAALAAGFVAWLRARAVAGRRTS